MRYLYKITNLINGKCYIGQTVNFKTRISSHNHYVKIKRNFPLYNAINAYGRENFEFKILCVREESFIDIAERSAIKYYNSLVPDGYNLESGGCKHKTASKETKQKQSMSGKGKHLRALSEETRLKISKSSKGRVVSDETRKKMSESRKNSTRSKFSDIARKNMSLAQLGKKRTPEMNLKRSIAQTGKKRTPFSEEARRNMSLCRIGKHRKKKELL